VQSCSTRPVGPKSAAPSESKHVSFERERRDGSTELQQEDPQARPTNRQQPWGAVGLITVGFGQDGAPVAIPWSDFRAGILAASTGSRRRAVLETLQCEVLSICVHDLNVVNGVQRQRNLRRHGVHSLLISSDRGEDREPGPDRKFLRPSESGISGH